MMLKGQGAPAPNRVAGTERDWALQQGFIINDRVAMTIAGWWAGGRNSELADFARGGEIDHVEFAKAILATMVKEDVPAGDMYALMGWMTHRVAYSTAESTLVPVSVSDEIDVIRDE